MQSEREEEISESVGKASDSSIEFLPTEKQKKTKKEAPRKDMKKQKKEKV